MNKGKLIVLIITLIVILGGAYMLYEKLSTENAPQQISDSSGKQETSENTEKQLSPAPDFAVSDAEGREVKLSDYIGKPVVVNFWASWCGPCKSEMPEFEEAYRQYGDKIQFMMVNLTYGSETESSARSYIASAGFSFPVFFDLKGDASEAYGISAIPATYFINSDGELEARAIGAMDAETLKKGIDFVLPK